MVKIFVVSLFIFGCFAVFGAEEKSASVDNKSVIETKDGGILNNAVRYMKYNHNQDFQDSRIKCLNQDSQDYKINTIKYRYNLDNPANPENRGSDVNPENPGSDNNPGSDDGVLNAAL